MDVKSGKVLDAHLRTPRPLNMSLNSSKAMEAFGFPAAELKFGLARL